MRSSRDVLSSFVDNQGTFLDCNEGFSHFSGFSVYELIGKKVSDVFAFDKQKITEAVAACKAPPLKTYTIEVATQSPGGENFFRWVIYADHHQGCVKGVHILGRLINKEKQAEKELLYQATLLSSVSDALIATDTAFVIKSWNKAAEKLYGLRAKEVLNKPLQDVVQYQYFGTDIQQAGKVLYEKGWWSGLVKYKRSDGREVLFDTSVTAVKNDRKEVTGYVAVNRDVTNTKHLQESVSNFYAAFSNVDSSFIFLDKAFNIVYLNTAAQRLTRLLFRKRINAGANIAAIIPEEKLPVLQNIFEKVLAGEQIEKEIQAPTTGKPLWFQGTYFPTKDSVGNINGLCVILKDITSQKELQLHIINQEKKNRRAVIRSIIQAQEKERKQLSAELHDNVNQMLTSCKLMLEVALEGGENAKFLTGKSYQSIQAIIKEIRKISHDLNPMVVTKVSFAEAIEQLIESVNISGKMRVRFEGVHLNCLEALDEEDKVALFRITQEQLNNIMKHAGATEVLIKVVIEENFISLTIKDNGVGFDVAGCKKGLGLMNIGNRVEYYNGKLNIESSAGKGCKMVAVLKTKIKGGIPALV